MATGYKLRDDFEAWVGNPHMLNRKTEPGYTDEYEHPWTCGAWAAWKECHERAAGVVSALVEHIEREHRQDQHNPYSVRELWPDLFAKADKFMRANIQGDRRSATTDLQEGDKA